MHVSRKKVGIVDIGGRGVGSWEGGQPNFGRGEWFLDPLGGGTSYDFLRGERGRDPRQKRKIFLTAAKGGRNLAVFFLKKKLKLVIFSVASGSHQLEGGTVVNKMLVWGGALFWTSGGGYSPPFPPPLPTYDRRSPEHRAPGLLAQ